MTEPTKHVALGASTCERWWNCPGSIRLIEKSPEPMPSKYAAEGTVAHGIAAEALLNQHQDWVDQDREADGFEFCVDDEMVEAVMVYAAYVRGIINEYGINPKRYMWVEREISIPNDLGIEMMGTADCVLHMPFSRLIVIDYKHGRGVKVRAAGNKQLMYYALGALLSMPQEVIVETPVVQMAIVQPRCPGGGIDSFEMQTLDLLAWRYALIEHAMMTQQPDAPLCAGDWCRWCPAKAICPKLVDHINQEAGKAFVDVQLPAVLEKQLPSPDDLTPEQISKILDTADLIKERLQAVHDYAYRLLDAGHKIPGYKLVAKRSNRKWVDEGKVLQAVLGLGSAAFANKLKSPKQMETALKGRKDLQIDLEPFICKPDNGYTVARCDDDRNVVDALAVRVFENVSIEGI